MAAVSPSPASSLSPTTSCFVPLGGTDAEGGIGLLGLFLFGQGEHEIHAENHSTIGRTVKGH